MESEPDFAELMKSLRAGDATAANRIFERFTRRLVRLAQTRLNKKLASKTDAEDVAQSAFKSFFRLERQGGVEADNWSSLWGLLAVITVRKCGHQLKYFGADQRDIWREVSPAEMSDQSWASWVAISPEPSSSQVAIFRETLERVMGSLDPFQREILSLDLQGYSADEIGAKVERSSRTVRRILKEIRATLIEMRGLTD